MLASEDYIPRSRKNLRLGLPPGGWVEVRSSGWMTAASVLVWFWKFVEFSKVSKGFPVLLILDDHSTPAKNLEVMDYARQSGVSLI